jgi:hypothetical protein
LLTKDSWFSGDGLDGTVRLIVFFGVLLLLLLLLLFLSLLLLQFIVAYFIHCFYCIQPWDWFHLFAN